MIRTTGAGRNIAGILICDKCQAESPGISIWSDNPLSFTYPTGWQSVHLRGNLWGHHCPACVTKIAAQSQQQEPTHEQQHGD